MLESAIENNVILVGIRDESKTILIQGGSRGSYAGCQEMVEQAEA
jgi:UDP-N-acetylglucosamine:LPS N-acetylglucosamine transferase